MGPHCTHLAQVGALRPSERMWTELLLHMFYDDGGVKRRGEGVVECRRSLGSRACGRAGLHEEEG